MALHKLILIVLQLPNQIKQIFPAKPCGAETISVKIALGIFRYLEISNKITEKKVGIKQK